MSKCPWCGKGEELVGTESVKWWVCQSFQHPGNKPLQ